MCIEIHIYIYTYICILHDYMYVYVQLDLFQFGASRSPTCLSRSALTFSDSALGCVLIGVGLIRPLEVSDSALAAGLISALGVV